MQEKLAKENAETQAKTLHQLEQERLDRAVAMQLAHDRGEDSATVGDVVLPRIAPAASASAPRRPEMVLVISGQRVLYLGHYSVPEILNVNREISKSKVDFKGNHK